jgi:hypothetical protein
MEIELYPVISLLEETFNILIAPVKMLADALNSNINLQHYKILFISGNYSASSPGWITASLSGGAPRLHILPAHDHPGGEPPQLPDRRA